MDFVTRMTALLSELRRERNGAVADAMTVVGRPCGLNLGVSIPTIRAVAAAESRDHEFAEYLYRQDVRELRIAALCLAEPEKLSAAEFGLWGAGIVNSEIAEQAAMLLFSRSECTDELVAEWGACEDALRVYCALMSAARCSRCDADRVLTVIDDAMQRFSDNGLVARGAAVALVSLNGRIPDKVKAFMDKQRGDTPVSAYLLDEVSWQI